MKSFIRSLKQRLIDQYWQNWHSTLMSSDRCSTFRLFKEDHIREHYVETLTISKFRKAFARFRMGITKINNNYRFLQPDKDRHCSICPQKPIEDEYHFLIGCPAYDNLRIKYLLRTWITLENLTVKDLIANNSERVTKYTATYIHYGMLYREERMIQLVNDG